jgi:hypothetical protein
MMSGFYFKVFMECETVIFWNIFKSCSEKHVVNTSKDCKNICTFRNLISEKNFEIMMHVCMNY